MQPKLISPFNAAPALLIVGHGTRDPRGVAEFHELARQVAALVPDVVVEHAFLELAEPTIDAGVEKLIERGVRQVVVVPLLLFAAGHAKSDIPDAVQEAIARHGSLTTLQAEHLGCDESLVLLSAKRFQEALFTPPLPQSPTLSLQPRLPFLVFIGRGSSDETALAEMQRFLELRIAVTPIAGATMGFMAVARPTVDEALATAAASGVDTILVQPHLLFFGDVLTKLHERVAANAIAFPSQRWLVAEHLGPDPAIARLIVERYRTTLVTR